MSGISLFVDESKALDHAQAQILDVFLSLLVIFICCFDFVSTYHHSATSGTPIMKKTIIVRIGILGTINEIPKHSVRHQALKASVLWYPFYHLPCG
jgi:hypothetical protein